MLQLLELSAVVISSFKEGQTSESLRLSLASASWCLMSLLFSKSNWSITIVAMRFVNLWRHQIVQQVTCFMVLSPERQSHTFTTGDGHVKVMKPTGKPH